MVTATFRLLHVETRLGSGVPLTVSEMIKIIEADDRYLDRVTESHRQFRHPVTICMTPLAPFLVPATALLMGEILGRAGAS